MAFDRAADLFRLRSQSEHGRFRLRAGSRASWASAGQPGRGREAGRVYWRRQGVPSRESIDLSRRGFQQLLTSGEHELGIAELRRVFKAVGLWFPETPGKAMVAAALGLAKLRFRRAHAATTAERID